MEGTPNGSTPNAGPENAIGRIVDQLQASNRNLSQMITAISNRSSFVIGVTVQAYSAILSALAGLTGAADKIAYFTGATSMATTDFTSTARSLLDDTSTSAMRSTLGLVIGTDVPTQAVGSNACIGFVIDGGGSVLTTGIKGDLSIPFACTINSVTLLADQSGSIVVDIWSQVYGSYPPVVAQSICASAKPTISTATKYQDSTLTGWTKPIPANNTLRFNVDSVTTLTRCLVSLSVTKT